MKKFLCVILGILCVLAFVACGKEKTDPAATATEEPTRPEAALLSLVESFDASKVNGFDYALEQTLNDTIVNRHTVSIRLNSANGTVASRVETRKSLNEEFDGDQFTETTVTTYYRNGQIATQENGAWSWNDGSLDEFLSVNLEALRFDFSLLRDLNLSTSGNQSELTFRIDDANAAAFLGITRAVKDLSFEIKADAAGEKLLSFTMRYAQDLTSTVISLTSYSGSTNITLPD